MLFKSFLPALRRPSISQIASLSSKTDIVKQYQRHSKADRLLSVLYSAVLSERFKDIVVIRTDFDTSPKYLLLASSFSDRHLFRGTESINIYFKNNIKEEGEKFADIGISENWNVLDLGPVIIHLFEPSTRKKYDIEQLWAVGENFDDLVNCESESSKVLSYKYFMDKVIEEKGVINKESGNT